MLIATCYKTKVMQVKQPKKKILVIAKPLIPIKPYTFLQLG